MKTVLTIAASDPSGGAGIQADLRAITAHGVYGMAVPTALTVQNTLGVTGVLILEPEFLARQLEAVLSDIRPDAVKIGAMPGAEHARATAELLRKYEIENVVFDPVLASTSGAALGTGVCFSLTKIVEYQMANGSLLFKLSMIPAAIAFLLVIPGETGNHPFDAAEAETEICEGPLAEYSGAPLGVYKLSHAVKILTMTSLFVALFLGGIGTGLENLVFHLGLAGGAAGAVAFLLELLVLFLLCTVLTFLSISVVHAVTARLRIEQLFKYYWTVVAGLALISLILAWYGL